ncbi:hypothetical protein QAD02_023900 [Eretmocerus hayati]|uniref:Uncharacterized protein n=1 Tax=Eretmocerus hayati TaxID=131215 RepID=A0ACC2PWX7_9HYME|nr:hypothetical protein QAD02_023900 [Eretmocerus hayati]
MSLYARSVEFMKNPILGPNKVEKYEEEQKLLLAVRSGNLELTRQLIQKGVDVNAQERNGKTCLYYATEKNDTTLARELLAAGAHANCNEKYSPLLNAIRLENTNLAKLLIKAQMSTVGIPINFKASFMAVELDQRDVLELLLHSGAEMISPHGETVLYHALENRPQNKSSSRAYLDILKMILNHNSGMIHIGFGGQLSPVKLLFENAQNQFDVLEFLLENTRFNIEEKDSYRRTALEEAITYNNANNVAILLCKGAKIDTTNDNGETPLIIAIAHNFSDCVEVLVDYGADLNPNLGYGITPFYVAVKDNRSECLEVLLASGAHLGNSSCILHELANSISPEIHQVLILTKKFPTYFFSNKYVLDILTLEYLTNIFPIYAKQIRDTFIRAKNRADLKNGAVRGLNLILGFDVRPTYTGENILKYLYIGDLQNLGEIVGMRKSRDSTTCLRARQELFIEDTLSNSKHKMINF